MTTFQEYNFENNTPDNFDHIDDDTLWNILDAFVSDDKKSNNMQCKYCLSENMQFKECDSKYICLDCAVESSEVFDMGPEWTSYEDSNETGRCGSATNPFVPNASLGTVIGNGAFGRRKRMQLWDQIKYKDRSLMDVFYGIEHNMKKHKITGAVICNAKILYKNISSIKHTDGPNIGKSIIIRGSNRKALIAACSFYGAKMQNNSRTIAEIAEIYCLEPKQVTMGCRRFLELIDYQSLTYNLKSSKARDFVERYCYKLEMSKQYVEIALMMADNIAKLEIASEHKPTSIAVSCILLMSDIHNLKVTKQLITDKFGISPVTITQTYNEIFAFRKILTNELMMHKTLQLIQEKKNAFGKETDRNIDSLKKLFIIPNDHLFLPANRNSYVKKAKNTLITNETSDISLNSPSSISSTINGISTSTTPDPIIKRPRGRPRKININANNQSSDKI